MFKQRVIRNIVLILLLQFIFFNIYCQDADSDSSSESSSDAVKVINNMVIDTEKKEIRIQCKLAITGGILEFFLVDEAGNTYESVFMSAGNKPSEMHFGLLLLGFEPVPYPTYSDLLDDEDALSKLKEKKCLLQCIVQKDNKEIPLSSIIRCREAGNEKEAIWVFTGASFTKKDNKYTADYTYNYMSIWPMMESVINLLSSAGNPYRGELGYEMAEDMPFEEGDEFILIIKEWKE